MSNRLGQIFFAIVVLVQGACFSSDSATTGPNGEVGATVEMNNSVRFSPATVTIKAGQAVRWTNVSTSTHTATANKSLAANPNNVVLPAGAQSFNSGDVVPGGQYTQVFTVKGRYDYVCLPHETFGMRGTVIVE